MKIGTKSTIAMKKIFYFIIAAVLSLVACSRNQEIDVPDANLSLYARTESPAETKTVVESGVHVFWEPGDEIAVFTGEESAKFTTDITAASGTATFKGTFGDATWPEDLDLWAVYPFSEDATFDGETITTVIPSVQVAREESFAKGANVSIAHSTSSNLQFYNVCGGVRFTVEEEGISSVCFTSSNHEPIAGKVELSFNNGLPSIASVIKGEDSIVLHAPEGTSFVPGKFYFFTALPISLSAGYTLSLYRDNQSASKEYQDAITIKRSLFGTLKSIDKGLEYHDIVTQEILTSITSIVEECIQAEGIDVNSFFTQRIDEIRNNPAVDEAFSNENGAVVFLKNGAVIEYPFHSESAFDDNDDSSTITSNVIIQDNPSTRAANSSASVQDATIVVFNLFSNAPGRSVQNQLIESTVEAFKSDYGKDKVYYGQFEDFSSDNLLEAVKSENCKALFVYSLGSGSGSFWGEFGDRLNEKLGFVDEGSIYYGQRLAIGEYENYYDQPGYSIYSNGIYYRTINLDSLFESSDNFPSSNKIIYFGSCYTLGLSLFDKDEWKNNTCVIGWTGMNCLGEAYGLVMAEYLTKYNKSFDAFWEDFGNSDGEIIDPLRDGLTSITNTCKSELVRKGALFLGIDSWPTGEAFEKHPNSLYIDRPKTGTCFRSIWNDATDKDYSIDVKVKYQYIPNSDYNGSQSFVNATAYGFLFKYEQNDSWGGGFYESNTSSQKVVFSSWIGTKTKKNTFSGIKSGVVKFEVTNPEIDYPYDVVYTFITRDFGYNDAQFDDPDEEKPTPEAVDLGLPSGIKWASFNLGATSPEDYGDYYAWGETEPNKNDFSWGTYSWCNGDENSLTKYYSEDGKTSLDQADDAAYNLLGGEWRMPTKSDWQELINNCSWTTTTSNGINGVLATSKITGATLFFPFSGQIDGSEILNMESSGYYWTSTLNPFVSSACIGTTSPDTGFLDRCIGIPIRPVYGKANTNTEYAIPEAIDLGLPSGIKWASFNLGATRPEEFGDYFAWGETEPYYEPGYAQLESPVWKLGKEAGYDWKSYIWCMGLHSDLTKYCIDSSYGYNGFTDGKTLLDPEDDAAHVNLGGKWRIPTTAELDELVNWCTWEWVQMNGKSGRKVTGPNGNWIFLPEAGVRVELEFYPNSYGNYWGANIETGSISYDASCIYLDSSEFGWSYHLRCDGQSIRPVYGDYISVESVSLEKTDLVFNVGETVTLSASVLPSNAANKAVTWSSSNESIATVSSKGVVTGLSLGSAVITVTTVDGGKAATCNVTVTDSSSPYVSIPDAVDLGLPSGIKWASFNLGAQKPEGHGDYYAWGEIEPYYDVLNPSTWIEGKKSGYAWSSYKWCMGSGYSLTKYCTDSSNGYNGFSDGKTILELEDDAAHMILGGKWRMPTWDEFIELQEECTWDQTSVNGVDGCRVTGPNGNSIFLPKAGKYSEKTLYWSNWRGEYWSSILSSSTGAMTLEIDSEGYSKHAYYRYCGHSVRPVYAE